MTALVRWSPNAKRHPERSRTGADSSLVTSARHDHPPGRPRCGDDRRAPSLDDAAARQAGLGPARAGPDPHHRSLAALFERTDFAGRETGQAVQAVIVYALGVATAATAGLITVARSGHSDQRWVTRLIRPPPGRSPTLCP
jgi:hypothetical protein